MLGQRRRRWTNVEPVQGHFTWFVGKFWQVAMCNTRNRQYIRSFPFLDLGRIFIWSINLAQPFQYCWHKSQIAIHLEKNVSTHIY